MCLQATDNGFDLTVKYYMLEKFEIFVKEAKFPKICKHASYYIIFLKHFLCLLWLEIVDASVLWEEIIYI